MAGFVRVSRFHLVALACVIVVSQARSQQVLNQSLSNTLADAGSPTETTLPAQPQTPAEFSSSAAAPASLTQAPFIPHDPAALDGPVRTVTEENPPERIQQELIFEGLVSYGNYKIFASGYDEKLFTAGVEYDRHSWGYFLRAQVDYVAEFLPFVLLDKPASVDIWGSPDPMQQKNIRQYVPGIGIFPIGFRMQWRSNKSIKPYVEAKGGMLGFTKKVPSTEATYENFSLQSACGVQVKMTNRWGLRLGLFSDLHFSNDFIVPVNPGLDVMNANLGFSYHF